MKVCRICLSKDGRLYPITSNGLRALYHQLIGVVKIEVDAEKGMPQWVCAECGLRLLSYNKLRQKSLRSHQILTDLLNRVTQITEEDINQIDRQKYNLHSNLSYCVLDQGIVQKYEVEIQVTDETDSKPKLKIEEFIINFELDETSPIFKTENASNEIHSETAVSNTENQPGSDECHSKTAVTNSDSDESHSETTVSNSDCDIDDSSDSDNGSLSSELSSSVNKFLKSSPSMKVKSKRVQSKVSKQVSQLSDLLDKKPTKRVEKNVIVEQETVKKPDKYLIEEVFTIQTLSLEEQVTDFEKRKFTKNYTDAPFKCDDCLTGFNNEVTFARHKLTHSDNWGIIQCKICKRRFRRKGTYRHHVTMHRTVYSCKQCNFVTKHRGIALTHKFQHSGKVFNCAECDLKFTKPSSYMSHLRIQHVSQFACEYCGFSFLSAKGVQCHKNLKHPLEITNKVVPMDGPACESCQIKFVSQEAFDTHLRVSHPQNPDSKKRNDGYGSKTNIICELCGVKTSDGTAYRLHYRRSHYPLKSRFKLPPRPKPNHPFVCELCGLVLKSQPSLRMHSLVHTGQQPYECDHCHKKFALKSYIKKHILNSHLPNRNLKLKPKTAKPKPPKPKSSVERYPCSVCGREFNHRGNRDRHTQVVHIALRQFICEICGSRFKSKAEVKTHTAHVHMKKPWPQRKERRRRQPTSNVE